VRRLGRVLDGWGWAIVLLGGGAVSAVLNTWRPWEVVGLVAVLGTTVAVLAGVGVWHSVRTRALELTALTSDEQAARLLGEALARCGSFLQEPAAREVWATFAGLPSETKRAAALAIVGFIGDADADELTGVGPKLVSIARSFRAPVGAS
jgi:hypothetical protein